MRQNSDVKKKNSCVCVPLYPPIVMIAVPSGLVRRRSHHIEPRTVSPLRNFWFPPSVPARCQSLRPYVSVPQLRRVAHAHNLAGTQKTRFYLYLWFLSREAMCSHDHLSSPDNPSSAEQRPRRDSYAEMCHILSSFSWAGAGCWTHASSAQIVGRTALL